MSQQLSQQAFHELSDLITNAEIIADHGPENEEELRDAIRRGEDLLTDLDDVEYELIEAIRTALSNGDRDSQE